MDERYIVFDVETPNRYSNRMSAIGITVIKDLEIEKSFYSLINPQQHFDIYNIALTGITPQMVIDKPTFPALWRVIEPIMSSGILIAHNAPFDMSVLAKCLIDYNIQWRKHTYYACTCTMGRRCYPDFPNHQLNTMCQLLDISLKHHNAGSDSYACAMLLMDYLKQGMQVEPFKRLYDLERRRTLRGV